MVQKKSFDVCIIGGGASGMTAAAAAAENGASVCVLEHLDRLGKKITATGNGKCNFTNLNMHKNAFRGNNPSFAYRILEKFGPENAIDLFDKLGLPYVERDGYAYPFCESAAAVRNAFEFSVKEKGAAVFLNTTSLKINKNGSGFCVLFSSRKSKEDEYSDFSVQCKKLIIASGGKSGQNLGSDGSGYDISKSFGHKIIRPLPALVSLKTKQSKFCKAASGTRFKAEIRLFSDNIPVSSEKGEILFTDYGISGIPVMQVSRFASESLAEGRETALTVDFYEKEEYDVLLSILKERRKNFHCRTNEEFFNGLLQPKLIILMLKYLNKDAGETASFSDSELISACNFMKGYVLGITGTKDFEASQVTAGGVSTEEISDSTLESKIVSGLYFAGEVIDIDGTCGGYNLHFAWATGSIAGKSAAASVKEK